jgi:hypothetical protein
MEVYKLLQTPYMFCSIYVFNSSPNFIEGNYTRSGLVPLYGDRNEQKRQRESERYATISDEKGSERNKKPCQRYKMSNQENVDLENNMVAHSTGTVVLLSIILIVIRVIINNNYYV